MAGPGNLLVRANAGQEIGTGHIMRCLALAQAWQDEGGHVSFLSADLPSGLETRLIDEGMKCLDWCGDSGGPADADATIRQALVSDARWLVIDGWIFGRDYQKRIAGSGRRVLAIDDCGRADSRFVDLILDQNFMADSSQYPHCRTSTGLLLGTDFVLLRREFVRTDRRRRAIPEIAQKILVTLGGTDPTNAIPVLISALEKIDVRDLEIMIIGGIVNRSISEIRAAAEVSPLLISFYEHVPNILQAMEWADLGVILGGGTLWECMAVGLPVASFSFGEIQMTIVERLAEAGYISSLGSINDLQPRTPLSSLVDLVFNKKRRTAMSQSGMELVDGNGARRVVSIMNTAKDS